MENREYFFDKSLNGKLQQLVDQGKLTTDERIVVNYHLSGFTYHQIRIISGKSYHEFLHIEQSIMGMLNPDKSSPAQANTPSNITITFEVGQLNELESLVLQSRINNPAQSMTALAKEIFDVSGQRHLIEKLRNAEQSALRKLQHPFYTLSRKMVRTKAPTSAQTTEPTE